MAEPRKSKISNTEWGLVISALFLIDLIQIIIEWLMSWWGVGIILNWIIDVIVGMSFAFYLQMRGQSLADPKRMFGLIGTFVAELIPVIDELPLWGMDGLFNMAISKSDTILKNIPGGKIVAGALEKANKGIIGDNRPLTQQISDSTEQIQETTAQIRNKGKNSA